MGMDPRNDIRDFLVSRRSRVTPVAMLAGISAEYYVRLERGNVGGVSEDVLEGIARALQLDEAERTHLFHLARAANTSPTRIVGAPAFVRNERLDVLAANQLGEAFYSPLFDDPVRPVNSASFVFLNPKATDFFVDWDTIANDSVGILRAEAGRDPYDKRLCELIGELSTRREEFRVRWAAHNVKLHRTGIKRFHHPLVVTPSCRAGRAPVGRATRAQR